MGEDQIVVFHYCVTLSKVEFLLNVCWLKKVKFLWEGGEAWIKAMA